MTHAGSHCRCPPGQAMCSSVEPAVVMSFLNMLYTTFDELLAAHDVYKGGSTEGWEHGLSGLPVVAARMTPEGCLRPQGCGMQMRDLGKHLSARFVCDRTLAWQPTGPAAMRPGTMLLEGRRPGTSQTTLLTCLCLLACASIRPTGRFYRPPVETIGGKCGLNGAC